MKAWSIPKDMDVFSNSVKTMAIVKESEAIKHYEGIGYSFTSRNDYESDDDIEGSESIFSFPEIDTAITIIQAMGYGYEPPSIPDDVGPVILPFADGWAMLIAPRVEDLEATA